ncbi:matrilysin family metalloendoprotease [Massilia sp. IC2-477]|uniref:matrixin family metalloprotease n=1 Tax=Massilia sp. IC2-477 TaxID=2887198 RepID=UPI001D12336E|nr:matrixin family metalloprotease [Massilia sp. IC2-477]MCC2958313.1 matrilysin family metalloendoprotease [Massilia sp. IC2-477]
MSGHKHCHIPDTPGLCAGNYGRPVEELQAYLQCFGYLHLEKFQPAFAAVRDVAGAPSAESGAFDDATTNALKSYQHFFELEDTGVLDEPTIAKMREPRCGFPDIPSDPGIAEFVAQGNRWDKLTLTYGFGELTPDLDAAAIRSAITTALNLWANVTALTFTEVPLSAEPDFVIRFVAGDHGDGSSFDGIGQVLAHAFYPPPNGGALAGDCHFDANENWTVALPVPDGAFDLVTVAAHEFGHSLGLAHSKVVGALMFPTYSGAQRALTQDDIDGIRSIYPRPGAFMAGFHVLKALAIEVLDRYTEEDLLERYGRNLNDDTQLDFLGITEEVRGQLAEPTNEAFFSVFPQWTHVSIQDTKGCKTIGEYITLVAKHAQIALSGANK